MSMHDVQKRIILKNMAEMLLSQGLLIDKGCTHLSESWILNQTKILCVLFEKSLKYLLVA